MDDYISREAARPDAFCEGVSCQECPFLKNSVTGGCRVDDFIKAIPAADVRPVVYGHMIGKEEAEKIFEEDYSDYPFGQCSVCGHCDWDCMDSEGFNYCPNCGAKMGGTP